MANHGEVSAVVGGTWGWSGGKERLLDVGVCWTERCRLVSGHSHCQRIIH